MTFQLKRRDGEFPPGQFVYADPRTGMKFDGVGFDRTVREIIKHRLANPKIYPSSDLQHLDFDSVAKMLSVFTCQRIGNNTHYCQPTDGSVIVSQPKMIGETTTMPKPCLKCSGTNGKPKYCPTCGGLKIISYICDCGFLNPK